MVKQTHSPVETTMIGMEANLSIRAAKVEMEANTPIKRERDDVRPTPEYHGKPSPQSTKEADQEQDFDLISPNLKVKPSVPVQRSSSCEHAAFFVPTFNLARKVASGEEQIEGKEVMPCRVEQKFNSANSQTLMAKKAIKARRGRTTFHPALVPLFVLGLVNLPTPVEATSLKSTSQILSENCQTLLKEHYNKCPNRAVSFEKNRWNELNKACCENYTGIFHCQHNEEGVKIYSMAACLPEETVPAGKRGKLVVNGTGYPKLDLEVDCPNNTFRDHSMNSSFILLPSCERKTKGEPEEEKWCDGGTSADDLFVCKNGFQAENCSHGHNTHDTCICLPQQCGKGSVPNRTVTGSCSGGNISVTYGCTNPDSAWGVSAITPRHQSLDSVSGERGIKGTSPATGTDHTSTSAPPSSNTGAIIGGVLGAILMVLIVIVLCVYWKRRRSGSYNVLEMA